MTDALAILAEPRRRRILQLVWRKELGAGEIASKFDVTFGAVSQHLAKLHKAGLIRQRRDGRKRWYIADHERLGPLAAALELMWSESLGELKALAEAEQRAIDRKQKGRVRHGDSGRKRRGG